MTAYDWFLVIHIFATKNRTPSYSRVHDEEELTDLQKVHYHQFVCIFYHLRYLRTCLAFNRMNLTLLLPKESWIRISKR